MPAAIVLAVSAFAIGIVALAVDSKYAFRTWLCAEIVYLCGLVLWLAQ